MHLYATYHMRCEQIDLSFFSERFLFLRILRPMLTENSVYSPDELYTVVYENSYIQYFALNSFILKHILTELVNH